ncbi:MAG: O-antigen ligase family protein [Clostridia bacterium]|nr:O-antigen ligase family protein [Clostridia bacterium]
MNVNNRISVRINKLSISIQDLLLYIVYGFVITSSIVNKNAHASGYVFMIPAILVTYVYSFLICNHKNIKKSYYIYLFFIGITLIFSTLFSTTLPETKYEIILSVLIWHLFFIALTQIEYSKINVISIFNIYLIIAVILSVMGLANAYNGVVNEAGRASIFVFGIRKDGNYFSAFLAPGFCYAFFRFLFVKRKTWYYLIAGVIILLGIYMTGSRAGFASVILSAVILIAAFLFKTGFTARKLIIFCFITAFVVLLYRFFSNTNLFQRMLASDSYSNDIRLVIWGKAIEAFKISPIFGSGRGSGEYFARMATAHVIHNSFIELLCDQGIVGVLLFLCLFAKMFFVKKSNIVIMIAFFVSCFAPLFFISAYQTCGWWLPIALCLIMAEKLQSEDASVVFDVSKNID